MDPGDLAILATAVETQLAQALERELEEVRENVAKTQVAAAPVKQQVDEADDEELLPTVSSKKATTKKKATAAPVEVKSWDDEDVEDELTFEEEKPKAKSKVKNFSVEDVNNACKAKVHALINMGRSASEARSEVLAILKEKFNVKSVTSLRAEQYGEVIEAMK
jgi:hypothetical protein